MSCGPSGLYTCCFGPECPAHAEYQSGRGGSYAPTMRWPRLLSREDDHNETRGYYPVLLLHSHTLCSPNVSGRMQYFHKFRTTSRRCRNRLCRCNSGRYAKQYPAAGPIRPDFPFYVSFPATSERGRSLLLLTDTAWLWNPARSLGAQILWLLELAKLTGWKCYESSAGGRNGGRREDAVGEVSGLTRQQKPSQSSLSSG